MPERLPPPADFAGLSLAAIAAYADAAGALPVDRWHPPHCGDSGMRIAADGTWFHEGAPIARPAMVRLFASILRAEPDGGFMLVTPVEKLAIAVDDAPFVAVELASEGNGRDRRLAFRLNTGGLVIAGRDHPVSLLPRVEGPRPYLRVRPGLDALLARPVYYALAELVLAEGGPRAGLWSDGAFFALDGA